MANEIGKLLGKVKRNMTITNNAGVSVDISVTFDFTSSDDEACRKWIVGARAIRFQNSGKRSLSASELEALDGKTIKAELAGQKIESRDKQIKALVASGIPQPLAELAVDDPDKLAEMTNKISE